MIVQLMVSAVGAMVLVNGMLSDYRILIGALGFLSLFYYSNAFNFMDGLNGIATVQAVITGLGSVFIGLLSGGSLTFPYVWICLVVSAAAAGFFPHNFPKPRMFMGDVGSVPLGFLLSSSALAISTRSEFQSFIPLLCLHLNFILDTFLTIVRRYINGSVLYESHREHFYQRLNRAGWSHSSVTGFEACIQIVVASGACFSIFWGSYYQLLYLLVVILTWLSFFVFCEFQFRKVSVS